MSSFSDFISGLTGSKPHDLALYEQAFTHGSSGEKTTYERLEFLGDRVLGLAISEQLFRRFSDEEEGRMSHRLNRLVSRASCADIARANGFSEHLRLGKQARSDGAADSDNVLGDVVEAVLGALFLDQGYEAASALVEKLWEDMIGADAGARKHPKSELQEWAAANRHRPPQYRVMNMSGPAHERTFELEVSIKGFAPVVASGSSKQEAEALAAARFLELNR